MISKSPAKLILSGEHAVLYTKQAVTCAINKHLSCRAHENSEGIQKQDGLMKLCAQSFFEYANISAPPLHFKIRSTIASNTGLGSSAAFIVGLLLYYHHYYNVPVKPEEFLALAQKVENYQHGKSSGIDIKTVFYGGLCAFEHGNCDPSLDPAGGLLSDICIVHTGRAKFSTKDVVMAVKEKFAADTALWQEFSQVTQGLLSALKDGRQSEFLNFVRHNQQLLHHIGIVPQKVQHFILELAALGIDAKVCGAGTLGDKDTNCGMLGIFQSIPGDVFPAFVKVVKKFQYVSEKVRIERKGAHIHAH